MSGRRGARDIDAGDGRIRSLRVVIVAVLSMVGGTVDARSSRCTRSVPVLLPRSVGNRVRGIGLARISRTKVLRYRDGVLFQQACALVFKTPTPRFHT